MNIYGRACLLLLPVLVLAVAGLFLIAGCDDAKAGNYPVVRLGYFANLTHAQAVLGVASGDYQRAIAPATLETKVFNAGPSLVEAMLAGEIDIGYVGPGPAIAGFTATSGRGLKVISGAAANGAVLVARPDSGINSPRDLIGKRLATPQLANTQDIAARHYLSAELKQTDLSNVLPIANAEQVPMFQRGEVDAAWVPEPWGSRLIIEANARLIMEEKDLWPNQQFATTIVVVSPTFLQKYPDIVADLLASHRQWTARLAADPQSQLPQLKTALYTLTRKQLPAGTLEQAISRVTFTDDPIWSSIQTMADWTYQLRFAKTPPNLEGMLADAASLERRK
jgi:NitT/TauT family transport system substrate-binding protein